MYLDKICETLRCNSLNFARISDGTYHLVFVIEPSTTALLGIGSCTTVQTVKDARLHIMVPLPITNIAFELIPQHSSTNKIRSAAKPLPENPSLQLIRWQLARIGNCLGDKRHAIRVCIALINESQKKKDPMSQPTMI